MSAKKITTRVQNKHDLEVNWLNAIHFVPLAGEIIIYDAEVDEDGDVLVDAEGNPKLPKNADGTYLRTLPYTYERMKIGDGKTFVSSLPFVTESISDVVLYTEQVLTEAQQSQARTNIGIILATNDDIVEILATTGVVEPITTSSGAILTDNTGAIYTL